MDARAARRQAKAVTASLIRIALETGTVDEQLEELDSEDIDRVRQAMAGLADDLSTAGARRGRR